MRPFLRQVAAVTYINIKSIPQRFWLSFSTVLAIALVVVVLLSFLAMANGFQWTLTNSGAEDVAIVLRGGSQSEINSTISRIRSASSRAGPASLAAQTTSRWSPPSSIWLSTASSARAKPRPTCPCAASARRQPRYARV